MLNDKYTIINYINSGNYGKIYKANINNKIVVLKESTNLNEIKYEANVYNDLLYVKNISKLLDFFSLNNKHYLVLDFYDKTLDNYKLTKFDSINYFENILIIFKKLYSTLSYIHDNNYIHRDLKPSNICLNKQDEPFIIDFGLSKKYIINNKHIECKKIKTIIGSYAFCSSNVENLIEPSRRDDLESLFYVIVYCFIKKDLEYELMNIKKNFSKFKNFLSNEYVKYYNNFEKLLNYFKKMSFTQKPNYIYLIDLLDVIE